MIRIPQFDIEQCINNGTLKSQDCIIVFGIYPYGDNQTDQDLISYNFVAYQNIMEVQSMTPVYGYVDSGSFSYFVYQETCTNCSIVISISSYSNGNPDIYISKGQKLPKLDSYDMR